MKYRIVKADEWVRPRMKRYKMMCCDCGLVHIVRFKIIKHGNGHAIILNAIRDNRATAASRAHRRRKGTK